MNIKQILYYFLYRLLLTSLTLGASLIIGLLSFGGFYALYPNLALSSLSFVLSVAYEGEIYLQNIKGALNKALIPNLMTIEYAKTFLKNYFPHHYPYQERPIFFIEYEYALHQLHAFEHQALTPSRQAKKQEIEEKLTKLEKKFSKIIQTQANQVNTLSKDDLALFKFLQNYRLATPRGQQTHISLINEFQSMLNYRTQFNRPIRNFSILTTIFMSFGTSYLLVEALAMIPFMVALPVAAPALIIPMAIISGVAYGLLTYNTLTNILIHDRIRTRIQNLKKNYEKNGLTWRNTLMITSSLVLGGLAVILTFCTAGTWWTILRNTPPLFRWIRKVPSTILGVMIPLVTGLAALAFNLENSTESLEMIDDLLEEKRDWKTDWANFKYRIEKQWARENILQRLNPFRLFLITVVPPLRFILFLGHLVSIGLAGDRVPGLSQTFSAFLGILSEFFEDGHYFIKNRQHQHDSESLVKERLSGSDHSHEDDLPSRLINLLVSPVYFFSLIWAYVTSQLNAQQKHRLDLKHIVNHNEIAPKIPLQHPIKANIQGKNSYSKIAETRAEPKKKKQPAPTAALPPEEETNLASCPCCPSPALSFYQNFARTKNNVAPLFNPSNVTNTQEKGTRRKMNSNEVQSLTKLTQQPNKTLDSHMENTPSSPSNVTQHQLEIPSSPIQTRTALESEDKKLMNKPASNQQKETSTSADTDVPQYCIFIGKPKKINPERVRKHRKPRVVSTPQDDPTSALNLISGILLDQSKTVNFG
jgi:hypothetical protein